jgi:hypothetical protein
MSGFDLRQAQDSTSQALEWLKQRVPGWGGLQYFADLLEQMRTGSAARTVTLKAPAGVTQAITITGRQVMVRPDLTIEVSEEDARPLYGAGFQKV